MLHVVVPFSHSDMSDIDFMMLLSLYYIYSVKEINNNVNPKTGLLKSIIIVALNFVFVTAASPIEWLCTCFVTNLVNKLELTVSVLILCRFRYKYI